MSSEGGRAAERADLVLVKGPSGAISLEMMPVGEGVSRAFLHHSPRGMKPSEEMARELSDALSARCGASILVADTKKRLMARSLTPLGWRAERAVEPHVDHKCSLCTTYEIPLDDNLQDDRGGKPDISNTSHMVGVSMDLDGRTAFGFYTDDGETARIVSEGSRKQGMLVGESAEDMAEGAECLIKFLAAAKKKWAVFSVDMGRFIRPYHPATMWRMVLEGPRGYDHSVKPLSRANRRHLLDLFSEYYDEGGLQSSFRLRGMLSDKSFSVFVSDGGFVVTRLEGETGLIYDIYVTPSCQGQGAGAELMRCGLSNLAGRAQSVYLHTSYPRAKAMYEKFGFKATYSQLAVRLLETRLGPPSR